MVAVSEPRRIKFIRFLFSMSGIIPYSDDAAVAYSTLDFRENLDESLTLPQPEDAGYPAAILTSLMVILLEPL